LEQNYTLYLSRPKYQANDGLTPGKETGRNFTVPCELLVSLPPALELDLHRRRALALGAHARDELVSDIGMARPVASAAKFFGRRCGTACFGSFFAVGLASAIGVRGLPALFGGSRDYRRQSGWCWHPKAHNTGNICTGDGSDGGDRCGFRQGGLDQAI
jgi:hypothetical protein